MLTVISPAKTLDFESPAKTRAATDPAFLERSSELVKIMREFSAKDLSKLMRISPKLGELNQQRFEAWQLPFTQDNAKQALLAFKGDVYIGLAAEEYSSRDFTFAQKNIRILSGLYGVLRPLDQIQAYRLEMGSRLKTDRGGSLYAYWGQELSKALNAQAKATGAQALVNCASQEYFGAVDVSALHLPIITPQFLELKEGKAKIVSFYAKKARGAMARFIVQNRLSDPAKIVDFDLGGYIYQPEQSTAGKPVFLRDYPA